MQYALLGLRRLIKNAATRVMSASFSAAKFSNPAEIGGSILPGPIARNPSFGNGYAGLVSEPENDGGGIIPPAAFDRC